MTLASDEHHLLKNLNVASNNLQKIAKIYGLKPYVRLKDLETLSSKVILLAEEVATMPLHSSSCSNSNENEEAVVRDVMSSLLSNKIMNTINSQFTIPPTSHIVGGVNENTRKNNKAPPNVDEIGKTIDDLAGLPQNYNARRSASSNLVGNNNMEFTGKPQQMN